MDDEKNTDNAWLENTVYNYHDGENIFCRYLLSVSNVLCFCLLEDGKKRLVLKWSIYVLIQGTSKRDS